MFYPKGHWRRMGDPMQTPASQLVGVHPDKVAAYTHLCQRPDLPASLVEEMVERAQLQTCKVTQSAMGMHLLGVRYLTDEQLLTLATRLMEHEYNERVVDGVLTHPRTNRNVLATLCWRTRPGSRIYLRETLEASQDPFVVATLKFTDAIHETNRVTGLRRKLTEAAAVKLARAAYVLGPLAATFISRTLPSWNGTPAELIETARGVTTDAA